MSVSRRGSIATEISSEERPMIASINTVGLVPNIKKRRRTTSTKIDEVENETIEVKTIRKIGIETIKVGIEMIVVGIVVGIKKIKTDIEIVKMIGVRIGDLVVKDTEAVRLGDRIMGRGRAVAKGTVPVTRSGTNGLQTKWIVWRN